MEEKEYSLSVLSEIVALTIQHEAAFLIMAGDIFDSFSDCENLRVDFRRKVEVLAGRCRVLFLPGNHEHMKQGNKLLRNLDLGDIMLLDREPFDYLSFEEVEFIAIPDQAGYSDYRRWIIPLPSDKARILIAHGTVAGLSYAGPEYAGPDGESGGSVLVADIFRHWQADYGALGHIHSRRVAEVDGTILAYPGSARVWRRGESGVRGLHIITIDQGIGFEFAALKSAGQYREYHLPLGLEAEVDQKSIETDSWQPADWIRLNFSGIVENEHDVRLLEEKLQQAYGEGVRRLEINRDRVAVLPGIASQPLAAAFLKVWQEKEPPSPHDGTAHPTGTEHARRVWLRARELGLRELKRVLEARD
jgi:DNA repair exonuclease SbcCD nuclease subunit